MCDQTEIPYKNGDVVWVKLGNIFWPGQVCDIDSIADDISNSFKKKPIAAVQFFGEDKYEFVKSLDHISLYNGRKKSDFLKKGIEQFRKQKDGATFMNKFPDDVKQAERLTGGNPGILEEPEFLPQEKQSYRSLFDGNKSVDAKKGGKRGRPPSTPKANGRRSGPTTTPAAASKTPPRPITHPRFVKGEASHDVRIRQQGLEDSPTKEDAGPKDMPYKCQQCNFTASRLNVIVLHNKFHTDAATSAKGKGKAKKTPKPRATPAAAKAKTVERAKPVATEIELPAAAESPAEVAPTSTRGSKRAVKRKIWADEEVTPPPRKAGRPAKKAADKATPTKASDKRKSKASDKSNDDAGKSPEPAEKKLKTPDKAVKSPEKAVEKKSPGKRKSQAVVERNAKKSKDDEEIREKLLADWDDEDAEQEQKEVEQLKKKPAETEAADPAKETSCFDFDDAKDAILDSELEKRAKKFVESRKTPRVQAEERVVAEERAEEERAEAETEAPAAAEADAKPEDLDNAINCLLADTKVPDMPQVPDGKCVPLPDVVLDSSPPAPPVMVVSSMEFSGGDHDYSARRGADEADLLDINSMPVVMTDDVVFAVEAGAEIDLAPVAALRSPGGHAFAFSENEMKMTQSVKSAVKAARSTTADRSRQPVKAPAPVVGRVKVKVAAPPTLTPVKRLPEGVKKVTPIRTAPTSSSGIAGGKYIIVQSPSGQQSRLTIAPAGPSRTPDHSPPGTAHKVQAVGGGKVVILTKPQGQQKILTAVSPAAQKALAAGKRPAPASSTTQRIVSATGQILTPVGGGRGPIPAGAKITPITGNQMRCVVTTAAAAGGGGGGARHAAGPRIQMQSLQTKVVLPSMQKMTAKKVIAPPPVRPGVANTIVIQSAATAGAVHARAAAQLNQLTRPRLLKSVAPAQRPGFTPKILQQHRSPFQPRMLVQKPRAATQTKVGVVAGMQSVTEVAGFTTQPQAIHKISQPLARGSAGQPVMTIIPQPKRVPQPPTVQRVGLTQVKPPARQKTFTITNQKPAPPLAAAPNNVASQEPPPLTPFQTSLPSLSLGDASTMSLGGFAGDPAANSVLTSEQLAQLAATSNNALGDGATYVLLTIDEAGNLHPYNNQSLISYDGSDQAGGALYIDSSSLEGGGVLDNMILTIGGSTAAMEPPETSWMPSASQDILAAALANTDVFPETSMQDQCVVDTSALLASIPSTLLLPSLNRTPAPAANVSETSLTLNQPIMSPLEVGSAFAAPAAVAGAPPPYGAGLGEASIEEEATFHPSMPLLSEEPVEQPPDEISFENANGTEAFHAEAELPATTFEQLSYDGAMGETKADGVAPTDSTEFVAEEASEVVATTIANEVSFESSMLTTTSANETPFESSMLTTTALTNEASAMMEPFLATESTPGLPQSMPLLCDDAVPESTGDQSQDSQASTLSEPAFE